MNPSPGPAEESGAPDLRRLRLRYAGTCILCGATLAKGMPALYERSTRTVRCLACPQPPEAGGEATDGGVPGSSAWREYGRRSARREERVKDQLGNRLGGLVLALTPEPQSTRAWERGARGEEELAEALAMVPGVQALYDRRVRGTRGNLDCLVVASAGVFVIDAKQYEGRIEIRNRGWLLRPDWRLYVGRRDCSSLAENMDWQVEAVEQVLVDAGVDPLPPITPVLCFVHGEWPLLGPPKSYGGVRLEGTRSIRSLITRSAELDGAAILRLARMLAAACPPK